MFEHPSHRTHLTGERPSSIAIVGLGPSQTDFHRLLTQHEPPALWDEVWSINTGLRYTPADVCWVMDDLREYGERFPDYGRAIRECGRPVITNTAYPEYPGALAYPLAEVLACCPGMHRCFYHNSVPYLLAYALWLGSVRRVYLFGIDYSYPDMDAREQGREVCAVWMGYLRGRGIEVNVTDGSTMLQAHKVNDPLWRPFYGYLRQPAVAGVTR